LPPLLSDLAIVGSANTVGAYESDLRTWMVHCREFGVCPFRARPRTAIEFICRERERSYRAEKAVTAPAVVLRLCDIGKWCAYLVLKWLPTMCYLTRVSRLWADECVGVAQMTACCCRP